MRENGGKTPYHGTSYDIITLFDADVESKAVKINGDDVIFQVWDTAGQERFRSLLPLYMKGIDGAVVVYSVTDRVKYIIPPLST